MSIILFFHDYALSHDHFSFVSDYISYIDCALVLLYDVRFHIYYCDEYLLMAFGIISWIATCIAMTFQMPTLIYMV